MNDPLLGRGQPVIPPDLYSEINEHNSLVSPGKDLHNVYDEKVIQVEWSLSEKGNKRFDQN